MKTLKDVLPERLQGRRTAIVVFDRNDRSSAEESVREMALLATTLGLKVVETFCVRVHQIHPATFLGRGKAEEFGRFRERENIFLFIFGEELTPVQQRNLEEQLGAAVLDRTALILQIFAHHATTSEGKIQVELAELNYLLPRLTGQGVALSRIGGGFATKGPGEMQLEVYRRRIRDRIHRLGEKIRDIEKHRLLLRSARKRKQLPVISVLGYTNVGKSTLINALSHRRDLHVADQLFSTLDPATRSVYLGNGHLCLMADTVGLLKDLPHHVIAAFKATLEEAVFADLLLCVYDGSSAALDRQISTTTAVLDLLELRDRPRLDVFNKTDAIASGEAAMVRSRFPEGVFVSARTGDGLDVLRRRMEEVLYGSASA